MDEELRSIIMLAHAPIHNYVEMQVNHIDGNKGAMFTSWKSSQQLRVGYSLTQYLTFMAGYTFK